MKVIGIEEYRGEDWLEVLKRLVIRCERGVPLEAERAVFENGVSEMRNCGVCEDWFD